MNSIFTYKDNVEGKVGIGKLPKEFKITIDKIANDYKLIVPNENMSTYHTWYNDLPISLKEEISKIQDSTLWNKLCDGNKNCIKKNVEEIDELYYSNPSDNFNKINLYGASNYYIHRDCVFNFNGIKFYRILIGLTNGNNNVTTHFTNLQVGHKLNKGDYIIFDFDKTTHQVIKTDSINNNPRILLKIHYIICENCHSDIYVDTIKQLYILYEYTTRNIMNYGTEPEGYFNFFVGLLVQLMFTPYIGLYIFTLILIIVTIMNIIFKIKFSYNNIVKIIKYIFYTLLCIYITTVAFLWLRYKIYNIR